MLNNKLERMWKEGNELGLT